MNQTEPENRKGPNETIGGGLSYHKDTVQDPDRKYTYQNCNTKEAIILPDESLK